MFFACNMCNCPSASKKVCDCCSVVSPHSAMGKEFLKEFAETMKNVSSLEFLKPGLEAVYKEGNLEEGVRTRTELN